MRVISKELLGVGVNCQNCHVWEHLIHVVYIEERLIQGCKETGKQIHANKVKTPHKHGILWFFSDEKKTSRPKF